MIYGCKSDPLAIDVSDTKLELKYYNFDELLWNADSIQLLKGHNEMKKVAKELYDYQLGYCLRIGDVNDSLFYESIQAFRKDSFIQILEERIQTQFDDFTTLEDHITTGFKHLKKQLPEAPMPEHIVFMNSLFASNAFSTETGVGIGMERYLGAKTDVIQKLGDPIYGWVKEGMEVTYLERDAAASWIMTHIIPEAEGTLSENMVRWGKILYLTEAAYPEMDPNRIMRYTKEDYDWAIENEYAFWKYLVDEDLLFKIDERTTNNMLGDGPFTPGLPEKGPDRLGQFLGWRMVQNYMKKNDIKVADMVALPYNEILQAYEIEE